MDFSAFATGARTQRNEDRRSRQQMAEAFNQFRASNPYATAEEFQSYIDQYSGGRNYIAGGAPTADILSQIGADNQRRKAQDETRQALADLSARQQTVAQVQGLVDERLLGMTDDNYGAAIADLSSVLGAGAADLVDLNGMMTPSRRDFLIGQQTRQLLPQAIELIDASDGQVTIQDLQLAFPNVSAGTLQPLLTQAQERHAETVRQREETRQIELAGYGNTLRTQITGSAEIANAVRMGDMDAARALALEFVAPYQSLDPDMFGDQFVDQLLTNMQGIASTQRQDAYNELVRTNQANNMELEKRLREANANFAAEFGNNAEGRFNEKMVGASEASGVAAAHAVAGEFDLSTPQARDLLINYTKGLPEGVSRSEAIAGARQTLADAGVPTLQDSFERASSRLGLTMPEVQDFDAWRDTQADDAAADFAAIEEAIKQLDSVDDLDAMDQQIAVLDRAIGSVVEFQMSEYANASTTRHAWELTGGGAWDDNAVFGQEGSLSATLRNRAADLRAALEDKRRAAENLRTYGMTPATGAPVTAADLPPQGTVAQPVGSFGDYFRTVPSDASAGRIATANTFNQARASDIVRGTQSVFEDLAPKNGVLGWFMDSTAEEDVARRERVDAVRDVLFPRQLGTSYGNPDPKVAAYLSHHPETIPLLQSDPMAWYEQNIEALTAFAQGDDPTMRVVRDPQ